MYYATFDIDCDKKTTIMNYVEAVVILTNLKKPFQRHAQYLAQYDPVDAGVAHNEEVPAGSMKNAVESRHNSFGEIEEAFAPRKRPSKASSWSR